MPASRSVQSRRSTQRTRSPRRCRATSPRPPSTSSSVALEDEYILEKAEEAGLNLPYDCRSGTCTTCIQKCLEGEIDQDMAFAIGDEELEQGLRLICIGSPLSDVVLDA
ncbi:MAG: 2Fe-2S iron-sulfur cluster-binding protein [Rubrobacter sp.]